MAEEKNDKDSLFGKRFREHVKRCGTTVSAVANDLELSAPNLYHAMRWGKSPSAKVMEQLFSLKSLGMDKNRHEWIALAEASRLGPELLEDINQFVMKNRGGGHRPMTRLPFAGPIGCGAPMELDASTTIELPADVADHGDWACLATGDSMSRAEIVEGDILIVRHQKEPPERDNSIVIAQIAHEGATCKRLKKLPDGYYLTPDSFNPMHKRAKFEDGEMHLLGLVTFLYKEKSAV